MPREQGEFYTQSETTLCNTGCCPKFIHDRVAGRVIIKDSDPLAGKGEFWCTEEEFRVLLQNMQGMTLPF